MKYWVVSSFVVLVLGFQNCSDVTFGNMPEASITPFCADVTAEAIQPKLKWDWYAKLDQTKEDNFPDFKQVMSTPMVADLNNDGISEVVFTTWKHATGYSGVGVLRIVDGKTGETIRSVGTDAPAPDNTIGNEDLAPFGTTSPLLIDLDADGKLEIIYVHYAGHNIIALNYDGSKRWVYYGGTESYFSRKGFAAVDIDKDGQAEIIAGSRLLAEDGKGLPYVKLLLEGAIAGAGWTFAASLNASMPSDIHLIANNSVYDSAGKKLYDLNPNAYAVANLDGDDRMELVGTGAGKLYITDALTGAVKANVDLAQYNELLCPKGIGGGVPTIGDFDGDSSSIEIALATGRYLIIMNSQGQMIAQFPTQDCSSLSTGISSFDFNGDGKPEILYGDEEYFRIFELYQGQLREIWSTPNPSGTLSEYPVVADIDGNMSADLIVASNNYAVGSFYKDASELSDAAIAAQITGVRAFESSGKHAWMPTRAIWNQYDYNPALVTDDGSAVTSTPMNAFTAKMFRRNAQMGMFEKTCVAQ